MTEIKPFMKTCFLCEREFQYGPHLYDGKPVKNCDIIVCNLCRSANWDGLGPYYEPKLLDHLKINNLPEPDRNDGGFLVLW